MSAELLTEHIWAVKRAGPRFRDRLRGMGISDEAMWRSMIGADHVQVHGDGTFTPDPDGTPMAILPVCDHYDPPVPLDLVAFTFAEPSQCWSRTGKYPVINPSAVADAWLDKRPLLVSGTPLGWIEINCEGVVVLDWQPSTVALNLAAARQIISFSPGVVASLTGIFKYDVDPPEIRLAEVRNAA